MSIEAQNALSKWQAVSGLLADITAYNAQQAAAAEGKAPEGVEPMENPLPVDAAAPARNLRTGDRLRLTVDNGEMAEATIGGKTSDGNYLVDFDDTVTIGGKKGVSHELTPEVIAAMQYVEEVQEGDAELQAEQTPEQDDVTSYKDMVIGRIPLKADGSRNWEAATPAEAAQAINAERDGDFDASIAFAQQMAQNCANAVADLANTELEVEDPTNADMVAAAEAQRAQAIASMQKTADFWSEVTNILNTANTERTKPAEQEAPAVEETPTPEDAMPMIDEDTPDFVSAGPERSAEFLSEQFGDDAESFIQDNIAEAQKALADAQGKKPKSTNFAERKKENEAIAQEKVVATAALDFWNAVGTAYAARQSAVAEEVAQPEVVESAEQPATAAEEVAQPEVVEEATPAEETEEAPAEAPEVVEETTSIQPEQVVEETTPAESDKQPEQEPQRDNFEEAVANQGYIERKPAKSKFSVWDFVAGKEVRPSAKIPTILEGVYYDKGFRVATDGKVLVKEKNTAYPAEYEGTARMRDGVRTDEGVKYPPYERVIPAYKQADSRKIDFADLLGFLNAVKERVTAEHKATNQHRSLSAALNNTPISMRLANGQVVSFSLAKLMKFALAAKQIGADRVYGDDWIRAILAKNKNGELALLIPVRPDVYPFEGSTRYYYAPELETKPEPNKAPTEVAEETTVTNVQTAPTEEAAEKENAPAEQPEEPTPTAQEGTSAKIEDFGEKIGGARKDVARQRIKDSMAYSRTDLVNLKDPDKILSRANIIKYVKEGEMTIQDATTLLALNMAVRGEDLRKGLWLERYRDAAFAWSKGQDVVVEVTDKDVDEVVESLGERARQRANIRQVVREGLELTLGTYTDYKTTYEALNYPEVNRMMKSVYIRVGRHDGKYWVVASPKASRGWPYATMSQAVAKMQVVCPVIPEEEGNKGKEGKDGKDKIGHLHIVKDERGYYRIKSRNIPGSIYLSKRFNSKKVAEQYLKDNAQELVQREIMMTAALMGSNIGMVERQGPDYRNGRDVTPQDFLDTFGVRGVEFGNWVPQAERQLYLNKSYDAIMDLCKVVGISPKAFSLGGRLALAFGSRGKSRALAHYEPLKEVINLTRMKGAGSLAHEWFHALDNYLSRQVNGNVGSMTTRDFRTQRSEVAQEFRNFVRKMGELAYSRRSSLAGPYWGEVWERAARLFESYVYNKLAEQNIESPLLVREDSLYDESNPLMGESGQSAWPYPSAEENEEMKPFFETLFGTIQEREENGKAVLYQIEESDLNTAEAKMSTEEVLDLVKAAGIEVEIATPESISAEEQEIIAKAKANGTYMKAPNGKPTNLTPRQWVQVRTKAFKRWFGDWEKALRIEKLRKSQSIEATGEEYVGKYELNNKSAANYINSELRGEYTNADTGDSIKITRKGAFKVTRHDAENEAHLKSIALIPSMLENAIFITEEKNEKGNTDFDSYRYYVVGINMGGISYTAKLVIGTKNGETYYDHSLTEIEKTNLIDRRDEISSSFTTNEDANFEYKDKRLISILQTNASKVVDANGEPKVVYHQTNATIYINRETGQNWDELDWRERMEWEERDDWDDYWEEHEFNTFSRVNARITNEFDGFFFAPNYDEYHEYGDRTIAAFVNIKNPASRGDYNIDSSKNEAGREERIRLQTEGYDGVIREFDGVIDEYIAFEPNQIKSATENEGTFDASNPDIRYLRETSTGEVYGWMTDGKIYLTEKGLNPETPIHEYTHIWDAVCQRENPKLWAEGVALMKQTPLWEEVRNNPAYANIADNEDALASEVHARLAAPGGTAVLVEMMEQQKAEATLIGRIHNWLRKFWRWLRKKEMPESKLNVDKFARMPLKDLAMGKRLLDGIASANGKQKVAGQEIMDAFGNVPMAQIGRRRQEEMYAILAKRRQDLSDAEKLAVIAELDKLDNNKFVNAAFHYFVNGTVRLPEDMPKVEQAVKVAEIAKVDPAAYKSPMELINAHADVKLKEARIDPDTVPTLSNKVEYEDGLAVYDVEESEESRQNMRRIINTHFGEDSSPWCLLQGDGQGNLTDESARYWIHYDAQPKRVAFQNGKLLAFFASDGEPTWWDRKDAPHEGIPATRKLPDNSGRVGTVEFDEEMQDWGDYTEIHLGKQGDKIYEEWIDEDTIDFREIREGDTIYHYSFDIEGMITTYMEKNVSGSSFPKRSAIWNEGNVESVTDENGTIYDFHRGNLERIQTRGKTIYEDSHVYWAYDGLLRDVSETTEKGNKRVWFDKFEDVERVEVSNANGIITFNMQRHTNGEMASASMLDENVVRTFVSFDTGGGVRQYRVGDDVAFMHGNEILEVTAGMMDLAPLQILVQADKLKKAIEQRVSEYAEWAKQYAAEQAQAAESVREPYANPEDFERQMNEQLKAAKKKAFLRTDNLNVARREGHKMGDDWRTKYGVKLSPSTKLSLGDIRTIFKGINTDKALDNLFDKVYAVASKLPLQISVSDSMPYRVLGEADTRGIITYNARIFYEEGLDIAGTLLRELIHSSTMYAITLYENRGEYEHIWSKLPTATRSAIKDLHKVYEDVKEDERLKGKYGLKDLDEFIAELSNVEFRKGLKSANLWNRFVNAIKRLFGFNTNDNLGKTERVLETILNNFSPIVFSEVRNMAIEEYEGLGTSLYTLREKDASKGSIRYRSKAPMSLEEKKRQTEEDFGGIWIEDREEYAKFASVTVSNPFEQNGEGLVFTSDYLYAYYRNYKGEAIPYISVLVLTDESPAIVEQVKRDIKYGNKRAKRDIDTALERLRSAADTSSDIDGGDFDLPLATGNGEVGSYILRKGRYAYTPELFRKGRRAYRTKAEYTDSQRVIATQAQTLSTAEIEEYINEVAKSLPEGVKVVVTNSTESGDREHTGWYDMGTDTVYINADMCDNTADVDATIVHELVGHRSMPTAIARVIGRTNATDRIALYTKLATMLPKELLDRVMAKTAADMDLGVAVDEVLAEAVENADLIKPSLWQRICSEVRAFFRRIFNRGISLSDGDIKYMFWLAAHNINNDAEFVAAEEMRYRTGVAEFKRNSALPTEEQQEYDSAVISKSQQFVEEWVDSLNPLKTLQEIVAKHHGELESWENAYDIELGRASRTMARSKMMGERFLKPLITAISAFTNNGISREKVNYYMIAKHGLERNDYFRNKRLRELNAQINEFAKEVAQGYIYKDMSDAEKAVIVKSQFIDYESFLNMDEVTKALEWYASNDADYTGSAITDIEAPVWQKSSMRTLTPNPKKYSPR